MTRRTANLLTNEIILEGLHPLIVPLDWIKPMAGNPRRGKVEAIAKSVRRFGQRTPIVVRKTGEEAGPNGVMHPVGYAVKGNHTRQAMVEKLKWTYAAVVWVDEDEQTASAYSLADNRSHDLGSYDEDAMATMVLSLRSVPELLDDAGFDARALERLARNTTPGALDRADGGSEPSGLDDGVPRGLGTPVIATSIVFDDEDQQKEWYRFIRFLRGEYPDAETTGERLAAYISAYIVDPE